MKLLLIVLFLISACGVDGAPSADAGKPLPPDGSCGELGMPCCEGVAHRPCDPGLVCAASAPICETPPNVDAGL